MSPYSSTRGHDKLSDWGSRAIQWKHVEEVCFTADKAAERTPIQIWQYWCRVKTSAWAIFYFSRLLVNNMLAPSEQICHDVKNKIPNSWLFRRCILQSRWMRSVKWSFIFTAQGRYSPFNSWKYLRAACIDVSATARVCTTKAIPL